MKVEGFHFRALVRPLVTRETDPLARKIAERAARFGYQLQDPKDAWPAVAALHITGTRWYRYVSGGWRFDVFGYTTGGLQILRPGHVEPDLEVGFGVANLPKEPEGADRRFVPEEVVGLTFANGAFGFRTFDEPDASEVIARCDFWGALEWLARLSAREAVEELDAGEGFEVNREAGALRMSHEYLRVSFDIEPLVAR